MGAQLATANDQRRDPVIPENSSFGKKAPKVAALLSQSSTARVLLLGEDLNDWEGDFERYFRNLVHPRIARDLEAALSEREPFQLILASLGGIAGASHDSMALLQRLRNAVSRDGSLILLAENRLALARLARSGSHHPSDGKTTAGSCRRRLRRAGFERVEEYLPLPRLSGAEEFVNARYGDVVLPSDASAIETALNKIGLLPMFSEGWYNICSRAEGGTAGLLAHIAAQLNASSGLRESVVIERFDLRERGALVLLLHTTLAGRRLVCRITTDERSDQTVRRNAEWTERIHRSADISPEIKRCVPKPIAGFLFDHGTQYVEELIGGTIAWKLATRSQFEPVMLEGMFDFLREFNRQTAVQVSIDETLFARLSTSPHAISMDHETELLTNALIQRLRRRTLGTVRQIVWSHGDFGYGNAIVDPRTGSLLGIIDWDQAREDLVGVDLLNFLFLRAQILGSAGLSEPFAGIAGRIADNGLPSVGTGSGYEAEFPAVAHQRLELLGWVTLRVAQRAATYPALLARSREGIQSLLRWACDTLPA
ncbi:MAG: aminoglycoside phosphotransferase family protein [Gemmatimonadota bacterium]|nr:aminoglycoside phosphotransferase family protein [Gemmatimonadota bacterium]